MKKIALMLSMICFFGINSCFASEKTEPELLYINSVKEKSEIPIEMKAIQYKEFETNSFSMSEIDLSKDYRTIQLISDKKNKKSNVLTNSQLAYSRKKSDSFFPGHWELQTKLY